MDRVQLLAAFQTLTMPEGAYGVTHERAREVILEQTGVEPVGTPAVGKDLDDYLDWLNKPKAMEPPVGTYAATARMMADMAPVDGDPDFWDRWKDEMKDGML